MTLKLWAAAQYVIRKALGTKSATKLMEFARECLLAGKSGRRLKFEEGLEAVATAKLGETAAKLIATLETQKHVVLRAGQLLIIKGIRKGEAFLLVETISTDIRRLLEQNPGLIHDPIELDEAIRALKARKPQIHCVETTYRVFRVGESSKKGADPLKEQIEPPYDPPPAPEP